MTTVDLITGFLGSGKTTFMKIYVRHLMDKGYKVCILENDFGAVNVDTMLLQELSDNGCGMETVAGACDKDCHQRRFKTKLIAMAMSGYDRVVIEPSGVFDVDEFFDTLCEPPLDRMYKKGTVVTIVDPTVGELSEHSAHLLASQAAVAGTLLFSHCGSAAKEDIDASLERISNAMKKIRCGRDPYSYYIAKPWDELSPDELDAISQSGCKEAEFVKLFGDNDGYGSVYFLNLDPSVERLRTAAAQILADPRCGKAFRVKGFTRDGGAWYEINATYKAVEIKPIANGQSVVIVIGESLNKDIISEYFT